MKKEIDTIEKTQVKLLELKIKIFEIKKSLDLMY